MNIYNLYGFKVQSAIDLGYPATGHGEPDILITFPVEIPSELPERLCSNAFEDNYQRLYWPFLGAAEIRANRHVLLTPKKNVDCSMFALAIIGPVMALLLHQREFLTLHASCVAVTGRAVSFLGDKGAGKSTMAAALIAAGHSLVADDITAVSSEDNCDVCRHAYPLMKLSLASLSAYPQPDSQRVELVKSAIGDKQVIKLPLVEQPCSPLSALFVLKRGDECRLTRMTTEEAYSSIMRYSYPIRFGTDILRTKASKIFLTYAADLASRLPVFELTSASVLGRLTDSVNLIEQAIKDDN